MNFVQIALYFSALVYLCLGLPFLLAPAYMTSFVGVSLVSATADNDIRAVYGGMAIGLAVFVYWAAGRREFWVPALMMIALTLATMSLSRCVSWIVVGWPDPIGFWLQGAETLGSVVAAALLYWLPVLTSADREDG